MSCIFPKIRANYLPGILSIEKTALTNGEQYNTIFMTLLVSKYRLYFNCSSFFINCYLFS